MPLDHHGIIDISNLINLKKLYLRTECLIRRDDIRILFQNLTNLTDLALEAKGHISGNEESLPGVTIVNLQKLKNLKLKGLSLCPEVKLNLLNKIKSIESIHISDDAV